MKQKLHSFVITVRMDKPCYKRVALREARDCIHGTFYCGQRDSNPDSFQVARITKLPKEPRK